MKKRFVIVVLTLLVLSTITYTSKGMTKEKYVFKEETIQGVKLSERNAKIYQMQNKNFEEYIKLLGISKKELIKIIGEKPTTIDEGGFEFFNYGIRVWFEGYGKGPVEQVYTDKKDVDFKGVKIGDKISKFRKVFGKPVKENTTSAYNNFEYNGIILSVYYDSKTGKTFAAYILSQLVK